jgi:hypothetical protein
MHDELIETLGRITAAAPIAPLFAAWLPRRVLPVVIVERPHVALAPIRK